MLDKEILEVESKPYIELSEEDANTILAILSEAIPIKYLNTVTRVKDFLISKIKVE